MKRYVKFMLSEFKNDSRNMREMDSVMSLFDDVIVFAPKKSENYVNVTKYKVHNYNYKMTANKFFRPYQIVYLILFKIPKNLKKLDPTLISCQDLFALLIGWISTLTIRKSKRPILVYDSHEFEIGRNTNGKRSCVVNFIIPKLEKFLMRRAAFSIFACDSAALEVQEKYRLKETPLVARNVPYKWLINQEEVRKTRRHIAEKFNLESSTFILLYHGVIGESRGIENLISCLFEIQDIVLLILGMGENEYIQKLKKLSAANNVSDRVLFLPAVSIEELYKYIAATDVGMITVRAVTKSYYYMLPNKFFENIQSLNPIICSNFPEVSKIIRKYDIGLTVNPDSVEEIKNAVIEMKDNKEMYKRFKYNLLKAKSDLCWENESHILIQKYKEILIKKEKY